MVRITLVVPCYNEAARLDAAAFAEAVDAFPGLRLCFVDDGSTDDTPGVLGRVQRQVPNDRVDILSLSRNVGKAEAVRQGLLRACGLSGELAPEFCGFWDADLSAPLTELPLLLAEFDRAPSRRWIWGIRLRALGREIIRGTTRHYLGRGFATATSLALGLGSYDTQCGAKLFRVDDLLRTVVSEPFISRWVFDVEMLSRADQLLHASGEGGAAMLVYEQPLSRWHHRGGSKVRATDFLRALRELVAIRSAAVGWRRPIRASMVTPEPTRGSVSA